MDGHKKKKVDTRCREQVVAAAAAAASSSMNIYIVIDSVGVAFVGVKLK